MAVMDGTSIRSLLQVPVGIALQTPPQAALSPAARDPLAALATLYREHHPFVWRCARRLGAPPELLDDVVQDVFLVLERRLDQLNAGRGIRSWLFATTLHVLKAHRRKDLRHRRRIAALAAQPAPSCQEAQQHEGQQLCQRLLNELDVDKRAVFILAEFEQMSAVEIGHALGVNPNTVYSRLRLARKSIRAAAARLGLTAQGGNEHG